MSLNCFMPASFTPIFSFSLHFFIVDLTQQIAAAHLTMATLIIKGVLGGGVQQTLL